MIVQRISELIVARRNETWMKKQGAQEYGKQHYIFMVAIHVGFFVVLMMEVNYTNRPLHPFWPYLLFIFFIVQIARIWVISSLGKYWNTKIIVLPGAEIVQSGPFKYIKHPNYCIVTIELLIIPIMFQAYVTAIVFLILNQLILAVRIPAEEKALRKHTNYSR